MKAITRHGIYKDLSQSTYLTVKEGNTYYFSSMLYKDKFLQKYEENRKTINESLSNRFDFTIKLNMLCDIALYKKIEKRGFLIVDENGNMYDSPDSFSLEDALMFIK